MVNIDVDVTTALHAILSNFFKVDIKTKRILKALA